MLIDVTVVITAYNIAGYIEHAVRSALDQQGLTLEVVVVDDASTDATWAVISSIHDARLTPVRLTQNAGPGVARNCAFAQARGEWIAVLDGDDVFLPGRLARMVGLAKSRQADIVVDNISVRREADGAMFEMFAPERLSAMDILTIETFIAGNANFIEGYSLGYLKPIFRRAFLAQHQLAYRESIRIGEDYLLLLSALASGGRCVVDTQSGYGYTARAGSISHRLTRADVARIQAEDASFFAQYAVSHEALAQQRRRTRNLFEAAAYNAMVEAIKSYNFLALIKAIFSCPRALRHLWLPLRVRLQRIFETKINP